VNGVENGALELSNKDEEVGKRGVYMGVGTIIPPHLYLCMWISVSGSCGHF